MLSKVDSSLCAFGVNVQLHTTDLWPAGVVVGGGDIVTIDCIYKIVTHHGPMTGGGGGMCHRNTSRTYDRRGWGGVCHRNTPRTYDRRGWGAIVTHHGPMTGGVVSKGGQIRVRRDAAPDAGQGLKNRTVRPKAGRMATLSALPLVIFFAWEIRGVACERVNGLKCVCLTPNAWDLRALKMCWTNN